jgi:hypothetical protein
MRQLFLPYITLMGLKLYRYISNMLKVEFGLIIIIIGKTAFFEP